MSRRSCAWTPYSLCRTHYLPLNRAPPPDAVPSPSLQCPGCGWYVQQVAPGAAVPDDLWQAQKERRLTLVPPPRAARPAAAVGPSSRP